MITDFYCCKNGDPFQGLQLGSYLTLGNELPGETHVLTMQEILLGKSTWVERSRLRESRRIALPQGFMVMGLVSGLSLVNHSDSESFLVFSHDGGHQEGFWEVLRHVVSPFDLSQTLPFYGGLLVPGFLLGTHANSYYDAWPGKAVSVSRLPLTLSLDIYLFNCSIPVQRCNGFRIVHLVTPLNKRKLLF